MSNFFAAKNERDIKVVKDTAAPEIAEQAKPAGKPAQDNVSVLGAGTQITGNIVCTGTLQVYGRIIGDIHASQLVICEGARVEGKIIAPEAIIRGAFNGSIHGNTVKLQKTASVEGEIYNKSLAIEQDARFEGVARRIDQPVAGPTNDQLNGSRAAVAAEPAPGVVPVS